jgi:uncharacterized protein (TIGR02453 family)
MSPIAPDRFTGFPVRGLTFYEGLAADNSKAYWTDHRAVYDECVAAPMQVLLAELEPEFGEAKFFRPYRDVRFSKDKTPYKTQAAAVVHGGGGDQPGGGVLYLALSADGLYVGGGYHHTATDQAQRLRAAIAEDRTGAALVAILDRLRADGWEVGGERLKRVPKPWDEHHPRAELLRNKSLTAGRNCSPDERMHTAAGTELVASGWRALAPLNSWLAEHVGPTRARR